MSVGSRRVFTLSRGPFFFERKAENTAKQTNQKKKKNLCREMTSKETMKWLQRVFTFRKAVVCLSVCWCSKCSLPPPLNLVVVLQLVELERHEITDISEKDNWVTWGWLSTQKNDPSRRLTIPHGNSEILDITTWIYCCVDVTFNLQYR